MYVIQKRISLILLPVGIGRFPAVPQEWNKVGRYCLNNLEDQHHITCFRTSVIYSQSKYIHKYFELVQK